MTNTKKTTVTYTVGSYLAKRLSQIGLKHHFVVAGDYNLVLLDQGSATGAINFITFSVTALIGPIFASGFGKTSGTTIDHAAHLRHTHLFWILIIVLALMLMTLLKETGTGVRSGARPPQQTEASVVDIK